MAATGHNHGLRIRVFGDKGSLEWQHEDPHHLTVQDLAGTTTVLTHGLGTLSEDATRLTRVGLGHPEGFLEAFANFYRDLADEPACPPRRHAARRRANWPSPPAATGSSASNSSKPWPLRTTAARPGSRPDRHPGTSIQNAGV